MRRITLALGLTLTACAPIKDEVQRVVSPNGELEVVVVRVNAGATVSFFYDVYLDPAGAAHGATKVADFYGVYRMDGRDVGVVPVWLSIDVVQLQFERARQGNVAADFVTVAKHRIVVRCSGTVDLPDRDNRCVVPTPILAGPQQVPVG